jgi:hypothetical protein
LSEERSHWWAPSGLQVKTRGRITRRRAMVNPLAVVRTCNAPSPKHSRLFGSSAPREFMVLINHRTCAPNPGSPAGASEPAFVVSDPASGLYLPQPPKKPLSPSGCPRGVSAPTALMDSRVTYPGCLHGSRLCGRCRFSKPLPALPPL